MAKNRYNTAPVDYTPRSERQPKEDEGLPLQPCLICNEMCRPYGNWSEGQTCSLTCEALQEAKPKLHGGQLCAP
jgi:hypothetical protein